MATATTTATTTTKIYLKKMLDCLKKFMILFCSSTNQKGTLKMVIAYTLNTAARERLADWLQATLFIAVRYTMPHDSPRGLYSLKAHATHAAGVCGDGCELCRDLVTHWALDTANSHAAEFEGLGQVVLLPHESKSGHTERIDFVESDFDITEDDDGEDGDA